MCGTPSRLASGPKALWTACLMSYPLSIPPGQRFRCPRFRLCGTGMVQTYAQSGTWLGYHKPLLVRLPRLPFLGFRSRMSSLAKAKTGWLTSFLPSVDAIFATFFFRYWHWMLLFTAWSTIITVIHQLNISNLSIQSTLLTVLGTVLGCTYISFHLPGNTLTNHTPQS